MKKIKKILLIAACVCLGLGAVLGVAGRAAGGRLSDLDLRVPSFLSKSGIIKPKYDLSELELDLSAVQVEIVYGDDFALDTSGISEDDFTSEKEDGKWHIHASGRYSLWGGMGRVTVTLPEDFSADSILINMQAGSLSAPVLRAGSADISVSAGELAVAGLEAPECSLTCTAGGIRIGSLDSDLLDISCSAGSVDVTVSGDQADYSIDASVDMGEISVGSTVVSGVNKEYNSSSGPGQISAACGIGSVKIGFAGKGV